jgi:hypothetical protein
VSERDGRLRTKSYGSAMSVARSGQDQPRCLSSPVTAFRSERTAPG